MMKKTLVAMLIVSAFNASTANAAGIPVVDIVGNLDRIVNHVEDVAKFAEQIEQLKAQLQQAQQMFNSMNGVRGMAQLLNNPTARQYLPADAQSLYNIASNTGQYSGLSGSLKAIKAASQLVKSSDVRNTAAAASLDKQQTLLASLQSTAEASYNAAGQRFSQLQQLVDSVDLANDPKAAQDLQNRIQAEQVMMQNENSKLSMMLQLQTIQQQQLTQQGREQKAKFGQGGQAVYVTGY